MRMIEPDNRDSWVSTQNEWMQKFGLTGLIDLSPSDDESEVDEQLNETATQGQEVEGDG